PAAAAKENKGGSYTITVNGTAYNVTSGPAGDNMNVTVNGTAYNVSFGPAGAAPAAASAPVASAAPAASVAVSAGEAVKAPVAGTLLKQCLSNGASVTKGQTVIIIESMKMELEVKAPCDGTISYSVASGTQVANGQVLAQIGKAASPVAPLAAPVAAKAASPAAPSAPSGAGKVVKAPVAGVLLRTAVSEGASVGANDTIIIIESMKMELEIKAGAAGKVHFLVGAGAQIANGQAVAEIG
ncbi:MAG TPA: oxaloacetate decarboxylase, partial [Treponema sp.]|nr:oxaloacetate decarboxylase [Treponema sp.]